MKKILLFSIITVFAILFISNTPSIVSALGTIGDGAAAAKSPQQPTNLFGDSGIFSQISNILLFIVGAIAVIMIVVGGLRYVISGGDSSQVTAAKNTILYAIVGVIIALLAYAAVNFIISSFSQSGVSNGTSGEVIQSTPSADYGASTR